MSQLNGSGEPKTVNKFQNSMNMVNSINSILPNKHIRIYHESKGGLEKSVTRIKLDCFNKSMTSTLKLHPGMVLL